MRRFVEYESMLDNSSLHYYCLVGNIDQARNIILENADSAFSTDNYLYWTPAHWAASGNQTQCLLLLKHFGAVHLQASGSMLLPLHIACMNGNVDGLGVLLDVHCLINIQDKQGETALHKACRGGHINCVLLLLRAGAQVDMKNFSNRTAGEVAALSGHFEVSSLLNAVSKYKDPFDYAAKPAYPDNSCKRQIVPELSQTFHKRRKFSDSVLKITSGMAVDVDGWMDNVTDSVLDRAA